MPATFGQPVAGPEVARNVAGGVGRLHTIVDNRRKRALLSSRIFNKVEALSWCIVASAVIFYGTGDKNLLAVVLTDLRIIRWCMVLGVVCTCVHVCVFLYLRLWLERICGLPEAELQCRWAIPAGSVTMVSAVFLFTAGIWPVFGFLSPAIMVVLSFGFVMSMFFIPPIGFLKPDGKCGA